MKTKFLCALAIIGVAGSFATAVQADEKLAKEKNCLTCHALDKKMVGPAFQEIAKKYKGDAKAGAALADKIVKGGSGVWGPIPMPPNKVTEAEAKTLAAWVMAQ